MGYLDTSPLFNTFLKSHKEVPPRQLSWFITQISLWFMVDIPILNGAYKPTNIIFWGPSNRSQPTEYTEARHRGTTRNRPMRRHPRWPCCRSWGDECVLGDVVSFGTGTKKPQRFKQQTRDINGYHCISIYTQIWNVMVGWEYIYILINIQSG